MITNIQTPDSAPNLLREQGYLVIPGFMASGEVEFMRQICTRITTDCGVSSASASTFLMSPELSKVVFSTGTLILCKTLFARESLVVYPNLTVRANATTGWHIDAAFSGGLGGVQEGPEFLQCAVYLQANPAKEGGGIDVVPGSHVRVTLNGREYAPAACLNLEMQARRIDSQPGDLIVWDARLLHRSSPRPASAAQEKFAIHWTVSGSEAGAAQFIDHLVRRGVPQSNVDPGLLKRYQDIASIRYPDHLSAEACDALRTAGAHFATLPDVSAHAEEISQLITQAVN